MVQFPSRATHPEFILLKRQLGEGRTFVLNKVFGCTKAHDNDVLVQTITAEIRARRDREQRFGASLFSDPAWDILLAMYRAHLQSCKLSADELCIASATPASIALRWIGLLRKREFIVEEHTSEGAPTNSYLLSELGLSMMQDHFNAR